MDHRRNSWWTRLLLVVWAHLCVQAGPGVAAKDRSLLLRVLDVTEPRGTIHVGLFASPEADPLSTGSSPATGPLVLVALDSPPTGEVWVSVCHDLNDNGAWDPEEPRFPPASVPDLCVLPQMSSPEALGACRFLVTPDDDAVAISLKRGKVPQSRLTVELAGFRNEKGQARVTLFAGPKGFPDQPQQAFATHSAPIQGAAMTMTFSGIPWGVYAVGVLHDENENGRMDANLLGIPREGYGASNDARGKRTAPAFADAAFKVEDETVRLKINVVY